MNIKNIFKWIYWFGRKTKCKYCNTYTAYYVYFTYMPKPEPLCDVHT